MKPERSKPAVVLVLNMRGGKMGVRVVSRASLMAVAITRATPTTRRAMVRALDQEVSE